MFQVLSGISRFGEKSGIAILLLLFVLPVTTPDAAVKGTAGNPLIAVFPATFPPVYSVTRNGLPGGFGIEFMEQVASEAGLNIKYRPVPTWFDAMQALRDGKADLIPDMGITDKRIGSFDYSHVIHAEPISIFVRANTAGIKELDDLKGKLTGVVRTNIGIAILADHPEIPYKTYTSLNDLYVGLLTREVDAAIYPRPNFIRLGEQLGTLGRVKTAGSPIMVVLRAVAVHKGNNALLDIINPAIDKVLKTSKYQDMMQRWFPEPPSFWNTKRVALLVALMLFVAAVIWQMYRVIFLKDMNKKLVRSNTFRNAVLDAALEGILVMSADGTIISANNSCKNMFGMKDDEIVGRRFLWLISGPEAKLLSDSIARHQSPSSDRREWQDRRQWECAARRSSGDLFPVRIGVVPMEIEGTLNFVCTLIDESRAIQAEIRAEQLLSHDPLTGLLNLHGIREELDKLLSSRPGSGIACLCIGMRRLTYINGVYGRRVGDQLLTQAASIIQDIAGNTNERIELMGRIGGERFFVAVSYDNPEYITSLSEGIGNRFNEFKVSRSGSDEVIRADAYIGIAYFPEHGKTTEELIYHAELAFYHARESKLELMHVFDESEEIEQTYVEQALQKIRSALNDDRVILHFQPIQNIDSASINHYEALVRIREQDGTLVMPKDIIPPAERFGLITRIDYRVIELALNHLSNQLGEYRDVSIAVNISAVHLGNSNLFAWLKDLFRNEPSIASRVIFEITESAALQNITYIRKFMYELKALGCRFSLDDFGVGFTSFAQLRELPVDIVKIDGMFVRGVCSNEQDKSLVKAITEVAHSLNKEVVAEFVENEAIYKLLRKYGVDYAQGYYIGKPDEIIPSDNLAKASAL